MIERYLITNELSRKRYRRFKRSRVAVASLWLIAIFSFFSFTAEFWANSKPIYLSYHGESYFPVFKNYSPDLFGQEDVMVMDYRQLVLGEGDRAIWPVITWDPFESNKKVDTYPSPPTKENRFGTDGRGRDIFTRILYGYRYSVGYAMGVWILSYIIGTLFGSLAGYMGGATDLVGSRVVEVIEMMPKLLLLITVISIFSPSILWLIIFSTLFEWTQIYYQMRGQFLQLRKREFIEAARALGASHFRIVFNHILPNALTPLVTFAPFTIAGNIVGLTVLDYLGLGLQAPTPSWGELISQSQKYVTTAEWLVWYPSAAVLITMVAMINIGLAVRDAYDSKA